MLIKLHDAIQRHHLKITGVIHVGAHHGQEVKNYLDAGIKNIILVEPCQKAFRTLLSHIEELFPGQQRSSDTNGIVVYNMPGDIKIRCLQTALGAYTGEALMHVEKRNEGQSNSILTPAKHLQVYSDIIFDEKESVKVTTLDSINIFDRHLYNMINMDVQGYEMEVLRGAHRSMNHIDYVYTEVNTDELYVNCAKMGEIDAFLMDFQRAETEMTDAGWGDAIYLRKPNTKIPAAKQDISNTESMQEAPAMADTTQKQSVDNDFNDASVIIGKVIMVDGGATKVETSVKLAEGIVFSLSDEKYLQLVAQIDKQKAEDLNYVKLREQEVEGKIQGQSLLVKELRDLFFEEDEEIPGEYIRRKMSAVDAGRFKEILVEIGAWH